MVNLKIVNRNEKAGRKEVYQEHMLKCIKKLNILKKQKIDLSLSVDQRVDDYKSGVKKMKVYRQMKMYNDSTLNPELYQKNNS